MIWYYIIVFISSLFGAIFSLISFKVTTLPLGMDSALSTALGYFRAFEAIMPPIALMFTALMWYISFRILLWTLKFFRILR